MYKTIVEKSGKVRRKSIKHPKDVFMARVIKTESCWLWDRAPNSNGYGFFSWNGGKWPAHRMSYRLFKGKIPEGLLVRHTCDNPMCVNPDHLVLGTSQNNAQDREGRGRNGAPKGSNSSLAKLDEPTVLIIRWLKKQGVSLDDLAALYHVSKSCIWGVVKRRVWKHLPEEKDLQSLILDDRTQYEITITVREIKDKTYQIVIHADTALEANKKALNMSAIKIHNEGWHIKGMDTKEVQTQVVDIHNPDAD